MTAPRSPETSIVWFRDDLRTADNPALHAAAASGRPVIALFVLDEVSEGVRPLGGATRWWLHGSLEALAERLDNVGVPLVLRRGPATSVVADAVDEAGAGAVFWNRRYAAAGIAVDRALKETLTRDGVEVQSFNASLLHEPWEVQTAAGAPFKVFSPFWRAAQGRGDPREPIRAPTRIKGGRRIDGDELKDWRLLPTRPDWAGGIRREWTPGEHGARRRLGAFVDGSIDSYAAERDRPDRASTSMLSPHLRFGEIGPVQLWHAARAAEADGRASGRNVEKFLSELGWREFSYHLLYHFPALDRTNFQSRFDDFPWAGDSDALTAWQRGMTGYPIVDAGMRQLWQTGWMHNRVRMVVASFLVKHLLMDWRQGEAWFWDTLVDADPANNPASWQWVAGSGADAAPYFRVFNPMLQGEKFDADGDYVRRFVPELAKLPAAHIHAPWDAPADVLGKAGVRLGDTYPAPMVDHGRARTRALEAFDRIKASAA